MVRHRTIAASPAILDDIANLHSRRRPALHVPTADALIACQTTAASDRRNARVSLCLARRTLTQRGAQLRHDGLAIGTAIGMVGHRAIAACLAILDDIACLHTRRLDGLAVRAAIGMVRHRTIAASLAILDDISSLHARRRRALHVPTASLGFLARQTSAASDGRSA